MGNLALDVTENQLRQEFTAFGQVLSVRVMNDKYIGSGQPRGYGFVEMASKPEGAAAIASLNGRTLGRRVIEVIEALPLSDKRETGSFHGRRGSRLNGKSVAGAPGEPGIPTYFNRRLTVYSNKEL